MAESTLDDTMPDLDELLSWPVDKAFIAAQREIAPVGKNGKNQDQKYNFRQAEDVIRACSGPMRKFGLRIFPTAILAREHQTRGKMNVTIIEVEWAIRGPQGDVMDIRVVTVGEAADASDKASNKAMTAAEKYALFQMFKIEVDPGDLDDGDRDHPAAVRSPIDYYLERLQLPEVWHSRERLREVLNVAANNQMLKATMPDNPMCTLEQYVLMRGRQLAAEEEERKQARAEEREALHAQMVVEHPTPGQAVNDPWAVRPGIAAGVETEDNKGVNDGEAEPDASEDAEAFERDAEDSEVYEHDAFDEEDPADNEDQEEEPQLPDPALVEQLLHDAKGDDDPLRALIRVRDRFGTEALERIIVASPWGQISAAAAIGLAMDEATPKRKTTQDTAKGRLLVEAGFQADMLGVTLAQHIGPIMPKGKSDPRAVTALVKLQKLIGDSRADVVEAMRAAGQSVAAEMYSRVGPYVPCRGIDKIAAELTSSADS
ncbi:ERF family protein [Streptomyces sp. NPDC094447]|uniref:ERF family protein n=1 Tax=Streptomyces sp. NPDC094447 TaxID=3366062 RepID=UPI00381859A5